MDGKNAHSGHRSRIRQRFLAAGQEGLYDHELLELLLFYARPVVNTNGIAHDLIDEFGSLGKVLTANEDKLRQISGVGGSGAVFLRLMSDLGLSYLHSSHSSETLTTRQQLCDCVAQQFRDSSARVCNFLCLSSRGELLRTVTMPADDLLNGNIAPKELAAMILKTNAASVCLGINHGNSLHIPTNDDYRIAHILGELLSAVGVGFADIIIHGGGNCFSMRGSGAFAF